MQANDSGRKSARDLAAGSRRARRGGAAARRRATLAGLAFVALVAGGCSGASSGDAGAAARGAPGGAAAERELLAKIARSIGEAPCTTDSNCRTLPIGSKACGGPAEWRPYSTANVGIEEEALKRWAGELAALQTKRHEAEGRMSDCAVVEDPGAVCRVARCVAGGGVRGPAAR